MRESPKSNPYAPADVLIVTALREELHAVKSVITGALGDSWQAERAPGTGLRIERRSFRTTDHGRLHIAVLCAEDMGGTQTAGVTGPIVMALRPQCLAMCGVLAGKPRDTEFGDVVFADQLFLHDAGKRTTHGFEHSIRPHKLDVRWLEKARDFADDPGDALQWLESPDWSREQQRSWLLDQFSRNRNPGDLGRLLAECCPAYETIIGALLEDGLVRPGATPLTEKGRRHVEEQQLLFPRWPGLDPPRRSLRVHVGSIASGNAVQADPDLWKELSTYARKTMGVEMEAHAVGTVAEILQVELAIVMKGVMDHADQQKDDRYKSFAARASAECLLAFLRRHLPARVRPGYDDILSSATAELPITPSPSQLLHPVYRVVPFYEPGRRGFLDELDFWSMAGREVRGRLVHGPGGFGKTRLAIEWTHRLRERGWASGFLLPGVTSDWFSRLLALNVPVAIVIDYAESRVDLWHLLQPALRYMAADGEKTRVRILLLARTAGDWWSALIASDEPLRALLIETEPLKLAPLAESHATRVEVFRSAAAEFASRRRRTVPDNVPGDLEDKLFDRALYLHMAALAMVEGLDLRKPCPSRREDEEALMSAILEHEERFWIDRQLRDSKINRIQVGRVRQLVAAATLRGGFSSHDEASAVVMALLGIADDPLLVLLHDIYGARHLSGRPGAYIGPLEPDLLGEGMVRRTFDRVDERSIDFIDRAFAYADKDATRHGFVILGRASSGRPTELQQWIARLLTKSLEVRAVLAFEAAKIVSMRTAFSDLGEALVEALVREGNASTARAILRAGIPKHTVSLRRVAVWVFRTLIEALPDEITDDVLKDRAGLLTNLGATQSELGQQDVALQSTSEAMRLYRVLAQRNPDAFLPDLALCLSNIGVAQSALGQREVALESTAEATHIYRELARSIPDAFLPELARCLNNLGSMQSELGQWEAALESAVEAVQLRRGLAERSLDISLPYLAASLSNLGNMQSELGQLDAALKSTSEAVSIRRELAKINPDAFLPDLATSLHNVSDIQGKVGQREAALVSAAEAVYLRIPLANKNPDAFLSALAGSLDNLGTRQSELGQLRVALESATEAVRLWRKLVSRNFDASLPDLASSLSNLSNKQSDFGQRQAALESVMEAVSIHRVLAKRNSDAFLPSLAMSLNNLSVRQSALGQREAALESAMEAVRHYRVLAERNRDAFLPDLANSVNTIGVMHSQLGEREAALASATEAVRLNRELTERNADAFLPHLARSLVNLNTVQSELEQDEAALESAAEAVRLCRELAERFPDAFLPYLAGSLSNLGARQGKLGHREAALASTTEAVRLQSNLAKQNPDAFLPDLAMSLNNLGIIQSGLGQWEVAAESATKAARLYRELTIKNSDTFLPHLAMSLNNLGNRQAELGRQEAALVSAAEAVRIYRELMLRNDVFLPDLARSLSNLGDRQSALGQNEAALASAAAAARIREHLATMNSGASRRAGSSLPSGARAI